MQDNRIIANQMIFLSFNTLLIYSILINFNLLFPFYLQLIPISTIMSKVTKKTVIQASDSQQSSPLQELATKKKQNNVNVQPDTKAKQTKKPVVQKEESEEDAPVQPKKKQVNPVRKGSKASVDDETPVQPPKNAASKGSVDKANTKKVVKPKEPSSESEQEVKPKKVVVQQKKQTKKAVQSSESEQEQVKKPTNKAVTKPIQKKNKESSEQSEDEIIAPPKSKKEVKQAKIVAKKDSSQSQEEVKPKQAKGKVVQPVKPVKKAAESEQQSEQSEEKPKPRKQSKEIKPVQKVVKPKQESEEQSEQQKPKARKASKDIKPVKATKKVEESEQSEEEQPQPTKKKPAPKKVQPESEEQEVVQKPKAKQAPVQASQIEQQQQDQQGEFEVAVQGLSFNAFDGDVRELFDNCGNILNVKLISRPDGKPKGFAFVKFSSKLSFNKALELNGIEHMGRNIRVEEARNNNQRGGQQRNNNSFNSNQRGGNNRSQQPQGNANIETPTLFIGGLSYNSTVDSIREFFSACGQVQTARIVTDKETGKPRGFGYVEFYDVDTAKKAYQELNGLSLDGRNIRLDSAAQRDRPPSNGFGGDRQGGFRGGNNNNSRQGSAVFLSQDDKNAKKGSIANYAGKKILL